MAQSVPPGTSRSVLAYEGIGDECGVVLSSQLQSRWQFRLGIRNGFQISVATHSFCTSAEHAFDFQSIPEDRKFVLVGNGSLVPVEVIGGLCLKFRQVQVGDNFLRESHRCVRSQGPEF